MLYQETERPIFFFFGGGGIFFGGGAFFLGGGIFLGGGGIFFWGGGGKIVYRKIIDGCVLNCSFPLFNLQKAVCVVISG